MKITAEEIAKIINGKVAGDKDIIITGASNLSDAAASDITFFGGDKKLLSLVPDTKAGVIIYPDNISYEHLGSKNLILVSNPYLAFAKILTIIDNERLSNIRPGISRKSTVSESATIGENVTVSDNVVIEEKVFIGKNTKILPNVYIGADVSIGDNCLIYPNVTIRNNVKIGTGCILQSGVVIGGDGFGYKTVGSEVFKIPQIGTVEIGNNVEVGSNTTIDRATTGKTVIGDNTKIDNLVMIAHNVKIGRNCKIVAQVGIAGSTEIGDNVTLAGQVGLSGHIKIGNNVMVGAKSGIMSDIEDGSVVFGSPAQPIKEHMKMFAVMKKLPEIYGKIKKLEKFLDKKED
ncbi:MAG: UDP-3-O-(3-hydroxymyristoyl)glucosamine N-acyltransferase [Endomicrobiaceae bacterium]|jgi:UDP-3-O-[3-hydroxymyristoyl] glucosamine N-acyltransferase|nr:UDP-3-O-(3-hydroxymyristoyl)glucosamine N-acyltransferase [Endomicrobiaceae bacterium]MDD3730356.1 UDP-3-O-(3-hydroxymyristoyl)glucosamine N-acyltransferase [Endomicrobiaceae bacterium]MDD4165745.1 UDP-3-O-(3-hydroxymyristoyl)glucosamine N-acyltransferase [Endomicrobiaceae bacterium]